MRLFLLFSALVAGGAAQQLGEAEIARLCSNLDRNVCRERYNQCIQLRRTAEDALSAKDGIVECATQYGISQSQILDAMKAAASSEGGEILDNLPVSQDVVLNIRKCSFVKAGLADANGNTNTEAIKFRLVNSYRTLLANRPGLLQVMLHALDSCISQANVQFANEYRFCLAARCVQNFQ